MKRTRNTVQRRAVLEAVRSLGASGAHPTAADVFAEVRCHCPHLSLATVYRALHALVEQREIGETRIENVARYDASPDPHHHVICRSCGAVADVFASLPPLAVRRLSEASSFALDTHAINFNGTCPGCQATSSSAAAVPASAA
ncbi:MAG TPA: transcriptional repressor [Armatimonadaceae bacterium]|nr:transcriptional repressor [Armatimonadaceae bacterium]